LRRPQLSNSEVVVPEEEEEDLRHRRTKYI
jgi:hypothetical protein